MKIKGFSNYPLIINHGVPVLINSLSELTCQSTKTMLSTNEISMWNHTRVSSFILLGITDQKELQLPLFVLFLLIYIITLMGNLGMILLIKTDSRLHIPMYFFLGNLAFVDVNYSSSIIPNMLVFLLTERKNIGFFACATQMFIFVICGSTECLLLAVMAFDRYVAICHPLHYSVIMSGKICVWLAAISYFLGIFYAVLHTTLSFSLSFCGLNMINHYYCDIPPLLKLSCSDTHINETIIFAQVSINCVGTTVTILFSYASILITILKIRSTQSRRKAFSTCSSHLIVVSLFYGTIFFMYLRPSSTYSLEQDKVASLFYTVVIPMLNPLIYSLRNKEVKEAFWRMFRKTV
ncbi:olfactory receptor 1019-like isoform X2 [Crotalus tigris]|uniref:olfactory receptor 1019-like isoform X2 n=1 Tax=Crotalus tigris TaxID=88082 RepID=UPI00192F1BC0|nr:olfactory receptor 1019-like isoform X2 [Crotalus tigris]